MPEPEFQDVTVHFPSGDVRFRYQKQPDGKLLLVGQIGRQADTIGELLLADGRPLKPTPMEVPREWEGVILKDELAELMNKK